MQGNIRFWLFHGRLNRKAYLIRYVILGSITCVLGAISSSMVITKAEIAISTIVISCILLISWLSIIVRRIHDINKSAKYALLLLVPVINIAFIYYLFFVKGTDGGNEYGVDPQE